MTCFSKRQNYPNFSLVETFLFYDHCIVLVLSTNTEIYFHKSEFEIKTIYTSNNFHLSIYIPQYDFTYFIHFNNCECSFRPNHMVLDFNQRHFELSINEQYVKYGNYVLYKSRPSSETHY